MSRGTLRVYLGAAPGVGKTYAMLNEGFRRKERGTDDAIPAEGAEELSWEQAKTVKLTAEQILEDPATGEMWLRSVQQDPSSFLAIKFGMQLQRAEDAR